MKTLKFLTALFFISGVALAQDINEKDVPSVVKDAFSKEYRNASDVEWEKKMANYKVEFDVDRMEHEIWYDASGKVLKKEQDITEADLPAAVREAIKSGYAGFKVDDVDKVWENGNAKYKVELEKGVEDKEVIFDANGKVIFERAD